MTEPPVESDRTMPARRWPWWIAFLAVVLVAAGAALWLRQSTSAPPTAPTSVADAPRRTVRSVMYAVRIPSGLLTSGQEFRTMEFVLGLSIGLF